MKDNGLQCSERMRFVKKSPSKIFKNYSWLKCRTLKFIIWFNSGSADAVESFDDKDKFIIWSKVVDFNDGEADETITEDEENSREYLTDYNYFR